MFARAVSVSAEKSCRALPCYNNRLSVCNLWCRPMKVRTLLIFFFLLGCLQGPPAAAETLQDIYMGETVVGSRLAGERRQAAGRALLQVMIRVTGLSWLPESRALQVVLADAERYMRSYRYRRQALPDGGEATLLSVRFEPRFVENILREIGQSIWPANRPNVVIWAVRQEEEPRLLGAEAAPDIAAGVEDYAVQRGLPARLPLMDLEDRRALRPGDVLRNRRGKLWTASSRYLADSVLAGFMSGVPGGLWTARWSYMYGDEDLNFAVSAVSETDCVLTALNRVREFLVARQALPPEQGLPEPVLLSLSGLNRFSDYSGALSYLSSLDLVREALPVRVEQSRVWFRLDTQASPVLLREAIALDRRLLLEENKEQSLEEEGQLRLGYQWPGER